jgi:deoxyribodipyrimidine photo-lyase
MRQLMWFRTDLRAADNSALHRAASAGPVVGLFVVSPAEWKRHDWAGCKVEFVLRNLAALSARLGELGIPLLIRTAEAVGDVPGLVVKVARESGCVGVHFNREYEVNEARRDVAVVEACGRAGLGVTGHDDQCGMTPGTVLTQTGTAYTVFTPFKRAWIAKWKESGGLKVLAAPKRQEGLGIAADAVPERVEGFASSVPGELWPGGERAGMMRLERFCAERIGRYKSERDLPAVDGTSAMSPYLASGVVSPRQCIARAVEANGGAIDAGGEGAVHWISEVIWREFYRHIVFHFPRVCMHRAFKPATDRIAWRNDEALFAAWREGRTGYPIVDAGMRQLAATGWMHNRLRMVTAMFLTKDLFIDWRWGEKHFMQSLVDGDLAQNNGGWQWSASTGTDAAPYFRIFNPASQSERYDAEGAFIRKWVPELKDLDERAIHDPSVLPELLRGRLDYPRPIVDHAKARDHVMAAFKAIGERAE